MALIIFPAIGYDSYVSVADATLVIDAYTVNGASWAALSVAEQEIYLRIALMTIEGGIDLVANPLPIPLPDCAPDAQALIAIHNVVNQLSAGASAGTTGIVKAQAVGSLKVEYFEPTSGRVASVSWVPYTAKDCLKELGYAFASTSTKFKQQRLGRM